ncbi:MAG: transporter substrate-binding domain-containing protein [Erysipelotrichaceae bacterium]|nr:transporter substrate-binding domain-containing protein [Erysipelotrichaceae bacterium]
MNKINKRIIGLICILLMVFSFGVNTFAEENKQKTVKIGYVYAVNYEEGKEGEYKRGSGYEYFQRIAYLTGWKYEYVYGSFSECYKMLVDGEIDLFGNVSYTPERAELFNFSDYPQGKDTYWLYAGHDDTVLTSGDTSKLNNCRIGVTKGSFQAGVLAEWLENKQIFAEIVPCSGYDEMMNRLDAGEIDAFAAPDLSSTYNYPAIFNIGFSDYYFAVAKDRTDILDELNAALYEIQNTDSDFNTALTTKYFYKMSSKLSFNEDEKAWLNEHDNTIRIGCFDNYLPFIGKNGDDFVGVFNTVIEKLRNEYGVNIILSTYHSVAEMKEAINKDEIDMAGPVVADLYLAELDDYVLTNKYY